MGGRIHVLARTRNAHGYEGGGEYFNLVQFTSILGSQTFPDGWLYSESEVECVFLFHSISLRPSFYFLLASIQSHTDGFVQYISGIALGFDWNNARMPLILL